MFVGFFPWVSVSFYMLKDGECVSTCQKDMCDMTRP